jgi:hypothetical protein
VTILGDSAHSPSSFPKPSVFYYRLGVSRSLAIQFLTDILPDLLESCLFSAYCLLTSHSSRIFPLLTDTVTGHQLAAPPSIWWPSTPAHRPARSSPCSTSTRLQVIFSTVPTLSMRTVHNGYNTSPANTSTSLLSLINAMVMVRYAVDVGKNKLSTVHGSSEHQGNVIRYRALCSTL